MVKNPSSPDQGALFHDTEASGGGDRTMRDRAMSERFGDDRYRFPDAEKGGEVIDSSRELDRKRKRIRRKKIDVPQPIPSYDAPSTSARATAPDYHAAREENALPSPDPYFSGDANAFLPDGAKPIANFPDHPNRHSDLNKRTSSAQIEEATPERPPLP